MPPAGVEPAPLRLKGGCSSRELRRHEGSGLGDASARREARREDRDRGPAPFVCHCYSVVREQLVLRRDERGWGRPDSNRVGARRRGYGPPRSPYRQRPRLLHRNGAASGIRTRVLDMASRDPSAGRWPRTHVEPPVGIEPTTSGLRNRRCCQLSYGGNGTPPRSRTSPWESWRLPLAQPARCVFLLLFLQSRKKKEGREPFGARPSENALLVGRF